MITFKRGPYSSKVDCYQSLNLLAHAQMEEFDLGSECGGHGVCGRDRIQLQLEDLKRVSPPTKIERQHLSAEQMKLGWRLACQCWPNADHLDIHVSAF